MNNVTLARILVNMYGDLKYAYQYSGSTKDVYIKKAMGKVEVLLEIAREENKK